MDYSDLNSYTGLSSNEAAKRLEQEGANEIPSSKSRSLLSIAFEVLCEPMFLLLMACGGIYFILGDIKEAMILLFFVIVVISITLYQERKTERALEALRDLSSPRAVVIRDGKPKRIPGRDLVRDDIIVISEGDRVPADAELLSCVNMSVDESLLTGESAPVRKVPCNSLTEKNTPEADREHKIYSGSLVVQGRGIAIVKATGIHTEIGKIGKFLQAVEPEETVLQKETKRLVKIIAVIGISMCIVAAIIFGITRGQWLNGILAGITLAMAMLPEEFPMVLTIFLAIGAWRISQQQVLTRKMPAVETLGSATVLCTDKTGTLTINRMTLKKIFAEGKTYDFSSHSESEVPETFHEIMEFAILASQKEPFDPMELALKQIGNRYLCNTEHIHNDWTIVREYPITKEILSISNVMQAPNNDHLIIAAKGAPESIADLCHLSESETKVISEQVKSMAKEGLRVLGVAKATFSQQLLPKTQHDFTFKFLGLVGFADPIRSGVPNAIQECYTAGVRVIMITGDYPETAQSIARQIGLRQPEEYITGTELNTLSDDELKQRIQRVNIFARVVPEQKLRIVNALKANGEIVAMTGDGVNDAPALKAANIGIAMGNRGTDVARESACLVLTNDDFSSIVQAIRMGRRIFDNLKKAMAYIFAIHVPIAGMSLAPIILNMPLVLFPVHIALLELIIDPACSVVFEAEKEEPDVMNRPPRDPKDPLFSAQLIGISVLQGLSVFIILLMVYLFSLHRGLGDIEARTLTFTSLIIANISLILTNRSWSYNILATIKRPNTAFWWVTGGAIVFLACVLFIPCLRGLCKFTVLHPNDIALCFVSGIGGILWFELFKTFQSANRQKKQ